MNVQPKPSFDDCLPDSRASSRMAGDHAQDDGRTDTLPPPAGIRRLPGGPRAPRTWTARETWPIELEVDPWRP